MMKYKKQLATLEIKIKFDTMSQFGKINNCCKFETKLNSL